MWSFDSRHDTSLALLSTYSASVSMQAKKILHAYCRLWLLSTCAYNVQSQGTMCLTQRCAYIHVYTCKYTILHM